MSEAERVALGDTIAGTNQYKVLASVMQNFNKALEATVVAQNSVGSAAKENTRYMESLEAQTNQLKATFQDLANNVIDNELIKSILNLANNVLRALNTDTGKVIIQWTLLTGVLTGGITIFGQIAGKLINGVLHLGTALKGLGSAFTATGIATGAFATAALPIAAIVAGITLAGYGIYKLIQEANPSLETLTERLSDVNKELSDNEERLKQLESVPWANRTPAIQEEIDKLKEANEELRTRQKLLKEQTGEKREEEFQKQFGTALTTYSVGDTGLQVQATSLEEAIEKADELLKSGSYGHAARGMIATPSAEYLDTAHSLSVVTASYSGATENLKDYVAEYKIFRDALDSGNTLTGEQSQRFYELQQILGSANEYLHETVSTTGELSTENRLLLNETDNLIPRFNEYNKQLYNTQELLIRMADNSGLTGAEMSAMVAKFPSLKDGITEVNGLFYANASLLGSIIDAELDFNNTDLDVEQKLAALRLLAEQAGETATVIATVLSPEALANYIDTEASAGLSSETAMKNYFEYFGSKYKEMFKAKSATTPGLGGLETAAAGSLTDQALAEFQNYYKDLKHLRNMNEIDEKEYYARLQTYVAEYTEKATKNMAAYGTDVETIHRNMYQYMEELNSYISSTILSVLQEQKTAINDYYKKRIDALRETNEELDKEIEKENALKNLAQARAQKVLVYKNGGFDYISDIDKVSDAQANLETILRKQQLDQEVTDLEDARDRKIAALDDEIEKVKNYNGNWRDLIREYSSLQDVLFDEEDEGISKEKDNWNTRLSNLQSFVEEYNRLLSAVGDTSTKVSTKGVSSSTKKSSTSETTTKPGVSNVSDLGKAASGALKSALAAASKRHANGTLSAPGGMSLVGEHGAELRVLGQGDGIVPADVTKNLWSWGMTTPSSMLSALSGVGSSISNAMQISIGNISLPSVSNASQFVEELKGFKRYAIQYGTGL